MKLVVPERGSEEAIAAWVGAERVVSSRLLYPEVRSAIGRAARSRRLRGESVGAARALAEGLWRDIERVPVTETLARQAGDLAEAYGLRAYDAVHLASAISIADSEAVLVAADGQLLVAAHAVGLTTLRPPA